MSLFAPVGTAVDRARWRTRAGRFRLLELFESVELATSIANAIAPHDRLQAGRYVQEAVIYQLEARRRAHALHGTPSN